MVSCEDGDYEQLYLLVMLRSLKLKPLTLSPHMVLVGMLRSEMKKKRE